MNWESIVGKNQAAQALEGNMGRTSTTARGTFIQHLLTTYPQN